MQMIMCVQVCGRNVKCQFALTAANCYCLSLSQKCKIMCNILLLPWQCFIHLVLCVSFFEIYIWTCPVHTDTICTWPVHRDTNCTCPVYRETIFTCPAHRETICTCPVHRDTIFTCPVHRETICTCHVHRDTIFTCPVHRDNLHVSCT
jgi:hypothetical protein